MAQVPQKKRNAPPRKGDGARRVLSIFRFAATLIAHQ
jgi:hypothetical protein